MSLNPGLRITVMVHFSNVSQESSQSIFATVDSTTLFDMMTDKTQNALSDWFTDIFAKRYIINYSVLQ